MRSTAFLPFLFLVLYSCKTKTNYHLTLEAAKDSCYILSGPANHGVLAVQKIQIIENTFRDTVVFGDAVLYPGYKGEFYYDRPYPDYPERDSPGTKQFCIRLYQKRPTEGRITIAYNLK